MFDRTQLEDVQFVKRQISRELRGSQLFVGAGIGAELKKATLYYFVYIYLREAIPENMTSMFPQEKDGVPIRYRVQGNVTTLIPW